MFRMLIVHQRNFCYLESHFATMKCYTLSLRNNITAYVLLRAKRPAIIQAGRVAKCVYLLTSWR